MTPASSLLLLAGIYVAVLASPGPNFFILSQMSLDGRRREARHVVYGLSTGSIVWVVLAVAGMATLFAQHPFLASAVRVAGAAYLVWYGARLLWSAFARRAAPGPVAQPERPHTTRWGAYRIGLLTGLTNPKGAAFWTGAYAAAMPGEPPPLWFYPATVLLVAALSLAWHLGITVVFGFPTLRAAYLRIERQINAVAGGALMIFGVQRLAAR